MVIEIVEIAVILVILVVLILYLILTVPLFWLSRWFYKNGSCRFDKMKKLSYVKKIYYWILTCLCFVMSLVCGIIAIPYHLVYAVVTKETREKVGLIADVAAALAIIVGVIYWIVDARERDDQRYYTAWTEINTAPHAPIGESVDSPSTSTQHNGEHNSKNTWDPCIDPFRKVGDSGRSVALKELSLNEKSVAGAPLSYAVLPRVELSGANMDRADLRHADLFGAHLNGADLWAADLRNANMSFAHLEGSHMIYAQLEDSCLQGAHLYESNYNHFFDHFISINETNFHLRAELDKNKKAHELRVISWLYGLLKTGTKVYFRLDDVIVKTDLRCSNLKGADIRGADLEGADLRYANLEQAKLGEFPDELLEKHFIKIEAYGRSLDNYLTALKMDHPRTKWRSTNLKHADLTGADLRGAEGVDSTDAILCHTTMPDGTVSDCKEKPSPEDNVCGREAPGAPGSSSTTWTCGGKQGETSTKSASKIRYTLRNGILNEVYYPRVNLPNVEDLQFIVSDGRNFVDLECAATDHQVQPRDPRALTYRQVNTDKAGRYRITKTYVTDVERPTLLIKTRFEVLSGGPYQLYVLYKPSLNGSGMDDTAATSGSALVASDKNVASALIASSGFTAKSSGYSGTASDGWVDLNQNQHRLTAQFDWASTPGNIVQIGQISVGEDTKFTLALGFGRTRPEAVDNAQHALEASLRSANPAVRP